METPSLVMFNTATRFRQAISFLYASTHDDEMRAHVWTETDADGIVNLHVHTEHGVYVTSDSTIKSELLDSDVWVNLHDFCVLCEEVSKENNVTMWVADGKLYIASSFNQEIEGFELECYCEPVEPFDQTSKFGNVDETLEIEQGSFSIVTDSAFDFEWIELHRKEGVLSYRSGNDRIVLATVVAGLSNDANVTVNNELPDFSFRIPRDLFRIIPMLNLANKCTMDLDFTNRYIRITGDCMRIEYAMQDAGFPALSSDTFTDYMKFDTLAMMATIETLLRVNYKDPVGKVTITPIDTAHASIEFATPSRYGGSITMSEIHLFDTETPVTLPIDILSEMIRNANCQQMILKLEKDTGRMMVCYSNKLFARKCYYLGK